MTLHSERQGAQFSELPLTQHDKAVLDWFSKLITERAEALAKGPDRLLLVGLVKRAVEEVQDTFTGMEGTAHAGANLNCSVLPVFKLKVSEVVGGGWVQLSQAAFYRAVDLKRFYCVTPPGRVIGKEFPAWQFVSPVPELLPSVLVHFNDMPGSAIHAFWVSEADELNALSPAEVLAGLPFATRATIHPSQWASLRAPVIERARSVSEFAGMKLRNVADLIG